jgi:hypothetical protein
MKKLLNKLKHQILGCSIDDCEASHGYGDTSSSKQGSIWMCCRSCEKAYPIWDLGKDKPH